MGAIMGKIVAWLIVSGLIIGCGSGCVATTNKAPVDGSYRVNELRGN